MKLCVVTTGVAAAEPRAVKQALALKRAYPASTVTLLDAFHSPIADPDVLQGSGIVRQRRQLPTRQTAPAKLGMYKAHCAAAKLQWRTRKLLHTALFGISGIGLTAMLLKLRPDVIIVHGLEALLPAYVASQEYRAKIVFDSMEYYAGMGDGQSSMEASAARALQEKVLPACSLVLAASEGIADALFREHRISRRPVPIYNTPPCENVLPPKSGEFSLYWRNYQVGFGQRGLDDVLVALASLPSEIRLYLQGYPPTYDGEALRRREAELGVGGRVFWKPPFAPGNAVREAAPHTIGLCLERRGPANHEYTVSNKLFDYMMAGLAVVSADFPGLRRVVERSGGGELFTPSSPDCLKCVVRRLYDDPNLTARLSANARKFALTEANEEKDMAHFIVAFSDALGLRPSRSTVRERTTERPPEQISD